MRVRGIPALSASARERAKKLRISATMSIAESFSARLCMTMTAASAAATTPAMAGSFCRNFASAELSQNALDTGKLLDFRDRQRCRPRRLPTDVDDIAALRLHPFCLGKRRDRSNKPLAVGKGIWRQIEDSHDDRMGRRSCREMRHAWRTDPRASVFAFVCGYSQ